MPSVAMLEPNFVDMFALGVAFAFGAVCATLLKWPEKRSLAAATAPFLISSTPSGFAETLRKLSRTAGITTDEKTELEAMADLVANGSGLNSSPSKLAKRSRKGDKKKTDYFNDDMKRAAGSFIADDGSPASDTVDRARKSFLRKLNNNSAENANGAPSIPQEVMDSLEDRAEWSFNVFKFQNLCYMSPSVEVFPNPLALLGMVLFKDHGLIDAFEIPEKKLWDLLLEIEKGYSKEVPYHNAIHATDVTQTINVFISKSGMGDWMTSLEKMAAIFSAIIHDYQHPGVNNNYLINSNDALAVLYNNKSVLENHHIASAFKLTTIPEFSIFENMTVGDQVEFRTLCIELVLVTDMAHHFDFMKGFKQAVADDEIDVRSKNKEEKKASRRRVLKMAMKCSDVSNPVKSTECMTSWTARVMDEFFTQGDKEKANDLPVSPLCDRESTELAKSQIGFIDFVVDPLYQAFGEYNEFVQQALLPRVEQNRAYWVGYQVETKAEE